MYACNKTGTQMPALRRFCLPASQIILTVHIYLFPHLSTPYTHTHTCTQAPQVTATDGDKDRPQNIVYFLTGQGIDPDNPANSKFDINRTTGEIFVLKVSHTHSQIA